MFDDLLSGGLSAIRLAAGRTVSLKRGAVTTAGVSATTGQMTLQLVDATGALVAVESRDYFIAIADYKFSSVVSLPQRGDRILDSADGKARVYEVLSFGGEPQWRFSDPVLRSELRIHTKEIEVT